MFNLIMLALPGFVKGKLPTVLKYAKWIAIVLAGCLLVYGLVSTVNRSIQSFEMQVKKASEDKILIAAQEKQIEQQKQQIEQIKQSLEEMKQSHEQTLVTINELQQERKKIEIAVTKKKKTIDNALKQIDNLDIPEADKDSQRSEVLIKGLNETYCELFKDSCKEGVN